MTSRELVIQAIETRMCDAFQRGALIDAYNLERFLAMLEGLSEADYEAMAEEEVPGAIS